MRCNRNDLLLYAVTDRSWLNGKALAGSGIAGAAVVSALFAQPDGERAARELRALLEKAVSP